MKIRRGFVSNSSSSSFTCDISGETASGYDLDIDEAGMCACENGHTMLTEYLEARLNNLVRQGFHACMAALPADDLRESFAEGCDVDSSQSHLSFMMGEVLSNVDMYYNVPTTLCPLCSLHFVNNTEMLRYLLLRMNRTYQDVAEEIRATYHGDPDQLRQAISEISTNPLS